MLIVKLKSLLLAVTVLAFAGWLLISPGVFAASASQAVAQGYGSSQRLQPGMIVRLSTKNPNNVVPLDQSNIDKMLGVVVSSNDTPVTLSQSNSGYEVYVTNFGQHNVLVTTQNGPIKVGDYITISSVTGLGMKADGSQSLVLGQAAGNFDGSTGAVGTTSLKGPGGQNSSISIGLIPVDIGIANNPLAQNSKGMPAFLSDITKVATNNNVSATRAYLSLLILLAGIILTITIVYASIKNGLISLGRNPLAKKSITSGIIRIAALAILIFAISLGAAYLVLL